MIVQRIFTAQQRGGTGCTSMAEPKTVECPKCSEECLPETVQKCSLCYSPYCPSCVYNMGGREFCSQNCAHYYFYTDEDEDSEKDD